jgi:hypothetical protein
LTLNFVLTAPSAPLTSGKPVIEFDMSNSTETLLGYGQPQ